MGTRSLLFMKDKEDNKYKGTYIHYDGYIDGIGKTLIKNYNNEEAIKNLISISNGAISSLEDNIEKTLEENYIKDTDGIIELDELDYEELKDSYFAEFIYIYEDDNKYYVIDTYEDIANKQLLQSLI